VDFVQIYRQVSFCFHFPSEAKKKREGITCNLRKGRQSTERKKRNCLQGTCSASNHMLAMPIVLEGSTCLDEARWSGVSGVLLAAVSCVPAWKSKRKAHPLSLSLSLSLYLSLSPSSQSTTSNLPSNILPLLFLELESQVISWFTSKEIYSPRSDI
jgi:hypothetical protein